MSTTVFQSVLDTIGLGSLNYEINLPELKVTLEQSYYLLQARLVKTTRGLFVIIYGEDTDTLDFWVDREKAIKEIKKCLGLQHAVYKNDSVLIHKQNKYFAVFAL